MKLYLYDFDGTIYHGDSSVDFFKFCLKKDKKLLFHLFKIIPFFIKYKTKQINITEFKEKVFSYLNTIDNIDEYIKEFWELNKKKIKAFYLAKNHKNDIIISASPFFLLKPICDELNVKDLIASSVDKKTGKFNKPNCRGEEKVKELKKKYPKAKIMEMYSDSYHDKPLLDLAEKSFIVIKNKIYDYHTYKPNILKRFWNWGWDIYHKNEEVWNYLIVGGLTTLVSIGSYAIFSKGMGINYIIANILSWILAVIFAYFSNKWFVFHSENSKLKEGISFITMRFFTLLGDTALMILFVSCLNFDDLIAKIIVQVFVVVSNYLISKFYIFK
ncbi:MAG: HAD-IB family phosphatase [Bacilli bacterium]|nr:HAD-IB family phosphatase [Bacilli bacterium]